MAVEVVETPVVLTHEQMAEAIKTKIESGEISERELLIEIYLFMHEMKQTMTMISSGKMGGLFGRLLGKMNGGDADA
jgi:hypothetical protein